VGRKLAARNGPGGGAAARTIVKNLLVLLMAVGLAILGRTGATAAPAAFDPTKVNDEFVVGGMAQGVAGDWLPDGRMVILTKPGLLYLVDTTAGTKSLVYTIPDVDSRGESGALDVVADLSFAANHTLYVYYSAQSDFRLRIARLVLDAGLTTVTTNTTLWSNPGPLRTVYADPTNHIGGSLDIGPDGKFYLSIGDALAGLSQDLTNVFGKVLRINMDGSVPADNPVIAGKTIGEIWAYGVRNPYRSQFERARTVANPQGAPAAPYWMGDVGGNVAETAYEEVNIGEAGKNYGWPLCEGPLGLPKSGVVCPSGVTGPALFYPHTAGVACCFNKAIIGGQMYRTGNFPLSGYYIFGDYPSSTISWMQLDGTGRVSNDSGLLRQLKTGGLDEAPVWIDISPDGNIYFLDIFTGNLRRLTYSGGATNVPPVITTAAATPTSGLGPLLVNFSGAATDANGDAITYLWTFGDGSTSTLASPGHIYVAAGTYQALLQVTAAGQTVNANPITITVGSPPLVVITSPANGATFAAGQTITATATAASGGVALPGSAIAWAVDFKHDNHLHPVLSGLTGSSVSFVVPVTGHDFSGVTGYRITATATGTGGVTATTSVDISPSKILVPVTANIATTAVLSGITQQLPFSIDTIPGFQHTVDVPASVCINGALQNFVSWSDGGARVHTIVAAAGLSLSATYAPGGTCSTIGVLRFSQSPLRTLPVDLNGSTQPTTGPVYVFLGTAVTNFVRVEFFLDDPAMVRAPIHTESQAPYDYVGGDVVNATALSLASLTAGSHTITARAFTTATVSSSTTATFVVGTVTATTTTVAATTTTAAATTTTVAATTTTAAATTTTTVAATTTTVPAATGVMAWSVSSARTSPLALQGQSFLSATSAYVFLNTTVTTYAHVEFWLDNLTMTGATTHTESVWPYDYVGGSVATAFPLSFAGFTKGPHTITVKASPASGPAIISTASFTVV
jgi:glucose/arabinose dehydrogenase